MVSQKLPISAFIITKNEESCIEHCILTLAECSEIVVVDSGSTDGTVIILERLRSEGWPIVLFRKEWPGFALQKQFALEQCTQPWALNIDADERLDPTLRANLPALLAAPAEQAGWRIARRPYLIGFGYAPAGVHEGRMLRLVRRTRARYDTRLLVHEAILVEGGIRVAPVGTLLHFRLLLVDDQITKESKYAGLKVRQLAGEGKSPRRARIIITPLVYFIRYYLVRRMFLCGLPGFIQAATSAVYAFLTEAKFYQSRGVHRDSSQDDRQACGFPD